MTKTHNQVTYLMSGQAHLPYLVCSLWTLRKQWDGHVEVHCWPESYDIAKQLEMDSRLKVYVVKREPKLRKKDGIGSNSQFLDKIDMTMGLDCGRSLYLDADTTIHGPIDQLFEYAAGGFCATQWNDWRTNEGMAKGRITELFRIAAIPDSVIKKTRGSVWPSVNGGVWCAKPTSPVLPQWYDWTRACGPMFISDERVLHLMMAQFQGAGFVVACGNGRWNSSPIYQSEAITDDMVVVRHYHGDSNVRPQKSEKGFRLWWPIYTECLQKNVGGMSEWIGQVKNKHLRRVTDEQVSQIICG